MKLRLNREELAEGLTAVCSVASVRTPKEILKCVRLEAHSDVLLLSATDLELGVRSAVTQIEVDTPGDTLVIADTLSRIVRECTDEILTFETEGNILHVRGMGSHFKIVTQSPTEFPPVPALEGGGDFTIEPDVLRRLIEWTVFAAARESTRYAINGVLWELSDERLTLAATDGRRLSVAKTKLSGAKPGQSQSVIVPTKTLLLFARLPGDADTVAVKMAANQILIKAGPSTISSSLIEGHFPKYQDVIPSETQRTVVLNTMEFLGAMKRAALLTNEESKGVRLSFSDGNLTLTSRAPEQGEAEISLPIDYKGEAIDIGFNPVFLTDVLRVAQTDQVTFAFHEPNRPGVVRINEEFVHVVMPVSLSA